MFFTMVQDEANNEPLSYRVRVFLDQTSLQNTVVTDTVLLKQHNLGPGRFSLVVDDSGYNCMAQDELDKDRCFDLDALFGEVFVQSTGLGDRELVLQKQSAGHVQHVNISELSCRHKDMKLVVTIRNSSATHKMNGFVF